MRVEAGVVKRVILGEEKGGACQVFGEVAKRQTEKGALLGCRRMPILPFIKSEGATTKSLSYHKFASLATHSLVLGFKVDGREFPWF